MTTEQDVLQSVLGELKVEFRPHPAREVVKNPITDQPILNDKGEPIRVPIIKDTLMVLAGGVHVAYCGTKPGMPVNFIGHFPRPFAEAVAAAVEAKLGGKSRVSMPPPPDVDVEVVEDGDETEVDEE